MALITNVQHFLDDSGALPADIPDPARHLALFLGAIVAWVTIRRVSHHEQTNVVCRKSHSRRRCSGPIYAGVGPDGVTITWECQVCGDNGAISGWEGTLWDRRSERMQDG